MPFKIIKKDIAKIKVDAVVNIISGSPTIESGIESSINNLASETLFTEPDQYRLLNNDEAIITKGHNVKAKSIIHVVIPRTLNQTPNEIEVIYNAYLKALTYADKHHIKSVAVQLYLLGRSRVKVSETVLKVVKDFSANKEMLIYLVEPKLTTAQIIQKYFKSVETYLDFHYERTLSIEDIISFDKKFSYDEKVSNEDQFVYKLKNTDSEITFERTLDSVLDELEETFSQSLLRHIDLRGMDDVEVYKKANVDRRLFSKIRSNQDYQPSKLTAIAFAIALELNLDETKDLLTKAGYALSKSSKFDLIIQYFIENENYDMYEINQILFAFDQKILGG